jgi:hypothetical protein
MAQKSAARLVRWEGFASRRSSSVPWPCRASLRACSGRCLVAAAVRVLPLCDSLSFSVPLSLSLSYEMRITLSGMGDIGEVGLVGMVGRIIVRFPLFLSSSRM